ncbi:MAG: hypothetical protein K2R98_24235 [Gemmataceae bacterium]|nr:hypothetical protein [Gemmataceae bacterium]
MAKDRRSKDQKRKAKLMKRAEKQLPSGPQPYSGSKYRSDRWTPNVAATEAAIYEAINLSRRTLTNPQVEAAFIELIGRLRAGEPAALPDDAPDVAYAPGHETEYVVWNIRRHWRKMFEDYGPVKTEDLIGILRTLLYSMEAQARDRGKDRGYVDFLYHFLKDAPFANPAKPAVSLFSRLLSRLG